MKNLTSLVKQIQLLKKNKNNDRKMPPHPEVVRKLISFFFLIRIKYL